MKSENNNINIKDIVLILLVLSIPFVIVSIDKKLFPEYPEINPVPPGVTKVYYTSGDDLLYRSRSSNINNYVYTIIEDDLLEEYYYALYYTDDRFVFHEMSWYIYDLAVNNQYCTYDEFGNCYVSDDEIKTIVVLKEEDDSYVHFYNTAQIESSVHGTITYESRASAEFQQVVAYASIIVQGPDTPGYEEALQSSYDIAERNDSYRLYYFKEYYPSNLSNYADEIEELNNMSVAEIVDNYDEYKEVIDEIEYYMQIR